MGSRSLLLHLDTTNDARPAGRASFVWKLSLIHILEAKYGFDKPVPVQFVNYLGNIARLDFGLSTGWVGSTVFDLIKGGFAYSARIGFCAAMLAIVLGVVLGALAALFRGKWLDKVIQVVTTALVSMPSFVMATQMCIRDRSMRSRLACPSAKRPV